MKKINLKHLSAGASERLTREQLKNVFGGNHHITSPNSGEGKNLRCCWISDLNNCSECLQNSSNKCVDGAIAVEC